MRGVDRMYPGDLDNPFWSSLETRHRNIACRRGGVARFPPDYAPFLGVAESGFDADEALQALVGADETVYLLGAVPSLADGWRMQLDQALAQLICTAPIAFAHGPEILELGPSHREDALALTALVYPHYFRPRTMELGRYFGIYQAGRLAAMIGERLGTDESREISAICTHPDFNGRGFARRLLGMLTNDNLQRGRIPFLHVSHRNKRALALYGRCGYTHRRDIDFWSLRRASMPTSRSDPV